MPTKDPHIAYIDAHEALEQMSKIVKITLAMVKAKLDAGGSLTTDEKLEVKRLRAKVIEQTKRIQDRYMEEVESHHRVTTQN